LTSTIFECLQLAEVVEMFRDDSPELFFAASTVSSQCCINFPALELFKDLRGKIQNFWLVELSFRRWLRIIQLMLQYLAEMLNKFNYISDG